MAAGTARGTFSTRALRHRLVAAGTVVTVVMDVTQQYLVGELSILVGELHRSARRECPDAVGELRRRVERAGPGQLAALAGEAIAHADELCWASLEAGDLAAFIEQATAAAALGDFTHAARLAR